MVKKLQLLTFLFLFITELYSHGSDDPFVASDQAVELDASPLLPKRGYPDPLPFKQTKNVLVSMHIPTIENPPSTLADMPRVLKVNADWVHTKKGDVIYNITGWFPLDKMRAANAKEEDRWVYYNQTSGYIIAKADQFLQSSIYDYVKGNILKHGISYRFSMAYLEVDDSIPLDVQAIERSSYKTLMKYSGTCRSGEKAEWSNSEGEFSVETIGQDDNVNYIDMALYLENHRQVSCCFFLRTNQWVIHECGISSAGKRRVLMVKSDSQNRLGQLVDFPVRKDQFVKMPEIDRECDPFGEREGVKYYVGYEVPPDVIRLLYSSEKEKEDPFGDYEDEFPEKYRGDSVDISELILEQGIQSIAVFDRVSSMVVAYATEYHHEGIEDLFATLGPGSYPSFRVKLNFYEIDARSVSEDYVWKVEDLLAGTPVKLASAGCMTLNGHRTELYRNENECEIELIRNIYDTGVDLRLNLNLDLPQIKLVKEEQLAVRYDIPKIMKVSSGKKGRVVVMMISVQKIVNSDEE